MPEVHYLALGDYCRIAAAVLGTTPEQIARLPRIGLADSALSSPSAGLGDQDAYPGLLEKAAVLIEHLARNHPLPDGNKRCAFLALERTAGDVSGHAPEPVAQALRSTRWARRRTIIADLHSPTRRRPARWSPTAYRTGPSPDLWGFPDRRPPIDLSRDAART